MNQYVLIVEPRFDNDSATFGPLELEQAQEMMIRIANEHHDDVPKIISELDDPMRIETSDYFFWISQLRYGQ